MGVAVAGLVLVGGRRWGVAVACICPSRPHLPFRAHAKLAPLSFLAAPAPPSTTTTTIPIRHAKESSCGCAGMFSAPVALAIYATAFERAQALDKLEGFARCGPRGGRGCKYRPKLNQTRLK